LCGGGTESKDSRESDLASARVAPVVARNHIRAR
jgi:hypothetical protein